MIRTFSLSFSIKNTYRTNSIIYAIKHIPLIGRLFPSDLYEVGGLKFLAGLLSGIWEFITTFLYKAVYVIMLTLFAKGFFEDMPSYNAYNIFLHIYIFLTLIGTIFNTCMFNVGVDVYYSIKLLRMNAKKYALANYIYFILRTFIGLMPVMLFAGWYIDMPLTISLTLPFYVIFAKITVTALTTLMYNKSGKTINENKVGVFQVILTIVLLAAAFVPLFFEMLVPVTAYYAILAIFTVTTVIAIVWLAKFDNYTGMYRQLLSTMNNGMDTTAAATKTTLENNRKYIGDATSATSNKSGFEYLNDLFIKRHKKLLWKPSIIITAVAAAIFILGIGAMLVVNDSEFFAEFNSEAISILPGTAFIMYLINRGSGFTQALFINCDHSMLTYSFYKKPQFILKLFTIRLREIIKINLLPAVVIAVGLVLMLLVSGGTDQPLYYIFIPLSIISMAIFFSVHYLTIYYLLQPYNANTEIKSGTFQFVNWFTYFVCYMLLQIHPNPFIFAVITTSFCVIYCIAACVLVYKFADKTFKIRL